MGPDMVFDDFRHKPRHRSTRTCDQVHDVFTLGLTVERTLDGLDLAPDAAHARQEFLLFADGMRHARQIP